MEGGLICSRSVTESFPEKVTSALYMVSQMQGVEKVEGGAGSFLHLIPVTSVLFAFTGNVVCVCVCSMST